MTKIHLVIGGVRSGKSRYAQKICLEQSATPYYLATARKNNDDPDFTERITQHQQQRSSQWVTIEEPIHLSSLNLSKKNVLLDCLTLWLTNLFEISSYDEKITWEKFQIEWDNFKKIPASLTIVSNEIGMGIHPLEHSSRKFIDLQGQANQLVAKDAHSVSMMVAGIPLKIK